MDRNYQPSLLWAYAEAWYRKQKEEEIMEYNPHDFYLYIYRKDEPGAYLLMNSRLYWQEEPMKGDSFQQVDQSALWDNKDVLAEMIIWDRRKKITVMIGKNYAEAWEKISA
jgi:hypothetical protein